MRHKEAARGDIAAGAALTLKPSESGVGAEGAADVAHAVGSAMVALRAAAPAVSAANLPYLGDSVPLTFDTDTARSPAGTACKDIHTHATPPPVPRWSPSAARRPSRSAARHADGLRKKSQRLKTKSPRISCLFH